MGFLSFLRTNALFLAAGVLLTFSSSYGQTFFISLFAGEIRESFGLTDGQWGGIYTAGTTLSAIAMVWAGVLTDKFRVRTLAYFVCGGLAVACLAMATVPYALLLIGVIFALRFFGQGMMYHLSTTAMARWFSRNRGKALSISAMGFALGQAILPVLFVAALAFLDWRWLWVVSAVLALAALPLLHRLLAAERTPQSIANETASVGMDNRHWTRTEVLRHRLFWLAIPLLLGPPAWGTALFFQQVHIAEVKQWDLVDYVALLPLFTAVQVTSTFASGALIDRFGTAWILMVYLLPFALGFVLLGQTGSLAMAAVAFAILGVGTGIQSTVLSAFWAEYFGTAHIGGIKAMAGAIMVLGSAIGPGVSGVLIDYEIFFDRQMIWYAGYFVFAACLVSLGLIPARRHLPLAP